LNFGKKLSENLFEFSFGVGSFTAALGQGFALGAVLKGIKVDEAVTLLVAIGIG